MRVVDAPSPLFFYMSYLDGPMSRSKRKFSTRASKRTSRNARVRRSRSSLLNRLIKRNRTKQTIVTIDPTPAVAPHILFYFLPDYDFTRGVGSDMLAQLRTELHEYLTTRKLGKFVRGPDPGVKPTEYNNKCSTALAAIDSLVTNAGGWGLLGRDFVLKSIPHKDFVAQSATRRMSSTSV